MSTSVLLLCKVVHLSILFNRLMHVSNAPCSFKYFKSFINDNTMKVEDLIGYGPLGRKFI